MARWLLPRLVLAALFVMGAALAYFEGIYLRDQHAEFAAASVAKWKWAFRSIAVGLVLLLIVVFVR